MRLRQIVDDAWLLADGDGLALVDAGFPDKERIVLDAIVRLGRQLGDLRHLVFTHHHPDHIGSAAAIVRATGAATHMSAIDAPIAETGGPFRPMTPAPGLIERIACRVFWRPDEPVAPVRIDHRFAGGDVLPIAGGLEVVATPGHCAGQVAFLRRGGTLLIAGDVGMNGIRLGDPRGFEDEAAARASQRRIAALRFERAAFGHGRPIPRDASARSRGNGGGDDGYRDGGGDRGGVRGHALPALAPAAPAAGLGAGGFMALYAVVAFVTPGAAIWAYRAAPVTAPWWPMGDGLWAVATVVMLAPRCC